MFMQSVNSSNIDSIGYASDELHIRFKRTNALYAYYGVPSSVYIELMNAPSHGKYFAKHIKGVYPYQRIG